MTARVFHASLNPHRHHVSGMNRRPGRMVRNRCFLAVPTGHLKPDTTIPGYGPVHQASNTLWSVLEHGVSVKLDRFCFVSGVSVGLDFHGHNIVEVMAPVGLRKSLALADGHRVEVGIKLGVVTSTTREQVGFKPKKLEQNGTLRHFSAIVTTNDATRQKLATSRDEIR